MRRTALFVGINHYEDPEIRDLDYAEEDAIELWGLFRHRLGFDRVERLRGPSSHEVLEQAQELVRDLVPGDLFLFYFAGHGVQPARSDHLLLCRKARRQIIEAGYSHETVPLELLDRLTERAGLTRVLILDACRSEPDSHRDAFGPGFQGADRLRDLGAAKAQTHTGPEPGGFHILSSCGRRQYAQEVPGLKRGLFSGALLELLEQGLTRGEGLALDDSFQQRLEAGMGSLATRYGVTSRQQPVLQRAGAAALLVPGTPLGTAARHEPAPQTAARPAAKDKILKILNSFREPAPPPEAGRRPPVPGEPWTEPYTGMEFLWVPPGEFLMGSEDGETNEKPVHRVRLQGFWLGKYPVTQAQWEKVMGNTPSDFKGADRPVGMVSWNDAQAFIAQLKQCSPAASGIRLPSEAEWEYAARSGGKREKYAGGNDPDRVAWYFENSGGATHPVGQMDPNGLGLYDMSGNNVWEWVQDQWSDNERYLRGGSRNFYDRVHRPNDFPDLADPEDPVENVGFRLAQD